MSTGLTYAVITDRQSPDAFASPIEFSIYDEALAFGIYMSNTGELTSNNLQVWIWTSGPNPNGLCDLGTFTPYDL